MGKDSKIEWCTSTWNPWMGCHKVSQGCKNCYMFREQKQYGNDPNIVRRSKTTFHNPLNWKEPRLVFTCSWSDFFIEEADMWRAAAWDVIRQTPHLTYQILTKRPENIKDRLPADWESGYPNVWLGISAEDQESANKRIPLLLNVPAAIKFISAEPLLGPLKLIGFASTLWGRLPASAFLQWVIVGGESGPNARPMHPDWARSIRNQCQDFHIPFFFKQWGAWKPYHEEEWSQRKHILFDRLNKQDDDRLLDGQLWEEFPSSIREKSES